MKIVDYFDSPYSNTYLKEDVRNLIFDNLCKNTGITLTTPMGKKIKVEPKAIRKFLNGGPNKVHTIERLRKKANVSENIIRNSITRIDDIETPSLPLNFDSIEGVRLDTGIFNEGRVRDRCVEYHNKDFDVIKIIVDCYKKITGGNPRIKISIDRRNNVHCIHFPPIFAKHYVKMGISEIPKIRLKSGIPEYRVPESVAQRNDE